MNKAKDLLPSDKRPKRPRFRSSQPQIGGPSADPCSRSANSSANLCAFCVSALSFSFSSLATRHSPLLPTALFPEPSFRAQRGISLFLSVLSVFSVSSVLIPFLPLNFQLLTFNLSICASLFSVTSVLNFYSPAAAAFRD